MALTGFDLREALDRLDKDLAGAHSAARHLLRVTASEGIGKTGPPPSDRSEATLLEELEEGLRRRYGAEFADPGWHGPTSFQRIVWQDSQATKAFARPNAVRTLLRRRADGSEPDLAPGVTLSATLIGGLSRNRPSYLLSACPNWRRRPAPVPFDDLEDMATGDRLQHMPFRVEAARIEAARAAALCVIGCAGETPGSEAIENGAAFPKALGSASPAALLSALERLCTPQLAARMMTGSGNPSVTLPRMNGQSLEVMAQYDGLVAACGGDHAEALGYGLVSHALDAKHLIAVLAAASGGPAAPEIQGGGARARASLLRLLRGAAHGTLGAEADTLMRARLQQGLFLIWLERTDLDLPEAALEDALASPAYTAL
jgi:hypothetical protein